MNQQSSLNQPRILVVDDESAIRRLLGLELRNAGYGNVTLCGDPTEAAGVFRDIYAANAGLRQAAR